MSDETPPKETTTDDLPRERACGTMKVHRRLLDQDPHYGRRLARIEDQAFRARSGVALRPGCVKIPVVVHVVHKTNAEDISQAQIDSQIAVLNRDFRKRNADVSAVPGVFAALAGDARVEFELAHTDPDGNPTNGITRTKTQSDSFSDDDDVKFTARGGHDAWPADEYLNVWVCRLSGGLLGYAQFPGGPAETDGVVIAHTAFGDTGTAAAPFNLGRTATHEIGHWLNLRHIWGDDFEGCSGSDFVDDTPNQGGSNVGKPTFPHVSCNNGPNGDLFMNYMDYVDDDTMVMFTLGQISRMQACLDGARSTIGEPIPCVGITPKGPVKEPPKEFVKDFPKDPIKDRPKEFVKEPIKEFIKEPPKEGLKDLPKDPIKDGPKDFGKEPPKDLGKEPPKDFGKEGIADPPKPIGLEPPVAFPPDIINPVLNPAVSPVATPNVPFVMGTGAGGFTDAELAPPASLQQGRGPGLADHYRLILSQYAALHRAGKLDEAGLASWQETWNAYQQLGGAS